MSNLVISKAVSTVATASQCCTPDDVTGEGGVNGETSPLRSKVYRKITKPIKQHHIYCNMRRWERGGGGDILPTPASKVCAVKNMYLSKADEKQTRDHA